MPLQILTDKTLPTKSEIALLYKVYGDIQECRKGFLAGAGKAHPLIMLTLVDSYTEPTGSGSKQLRAVCLGKNSTRLERTSSCEGKKNCCKRVRE